MQTCISHEVNICQGTKNSGQSSPSFDLMMRLPLAFRFAAAAPRLALARRSKRTRDDDFHDRFIEVDVRHAGGAVKRHELTIVRIAGLIVRATAP